MNYPEGLLIELGDRINIGGGLAGTVVAIIHQQKYKDGFKIEEWGYLKKGIIIKTDTFGILHLDVLNEDVSLINRELIG